MLRVLFLILFFMLCTQRNAVRVGYEMSSSFPDAGDPKAKKKDKEKPSQAQKQLCDKKTPTKKKDETRDTRQATDEAIKDMAMEL